MLHALVGDNYRRQVIMVLWIIGNNRLLEVIMLQLFILNTTSQENFHLT